MELKTFLEDLERRISPEDEDRLEQTWLEFADQKLTEGYFAPSRPPVAPKIPWPHLPTNDTLEDIDHMIYSQLNMCSDMLAGGTGEMMCLRPNYGTGVIPSMYGAEVFIMPYEHDILPGSRALAGGGNDIRAIVERGEMDFTAGFAGKVFAVGERFRELVAGYPKVQRYIHCYNPDLQGPLPLCEAMWGSDIYMEFYDDPDGVEAALDFFTSVYITFTKKWHALCPTLDAGHSVEWGMLHQGGTIIRNDAAMNISGDLYKEFVQPRDQRIIDTFGGGVHFCGKGDHYIPHLADIRGLSVINLSQPEYNDMETIYRNTVDRDIIIMGLRSDEVQSAHSRRPLRGKVHRGASMAAWLEAEKR